MIDLPYFLVWKAKGLYIYKKMYIHVNEGQKEIIRILIRYKQNFLYPQGMQGV